MAAGRSDILDIAVTLHHATERAVLVSDDGDRARAVWLPLALVEIERQAGGTAVVSLPEWLAIDKGLA